MASDIETVTRVLAERHQGCVIRGDKHTRSMAAEVVAALNLPGVRAQALRDAASDPTLRLSGHSGVSIKRLRAEADRIEGGTAKAREAALAAIVPVDGYTPEDF